MSDKNQTAKLVTQTFDRKTWYFREVSVNDKDYLANSLESFEIRSESNIHISIVLSEASKFSHTLAGRSLSTRTQKG